MRVKRKRVDVNLEELDRVLDHAREAPLSEPDYDKLKEALHALAGMLPAPRSTEKTSAVLPPTDPPTQQSKEKPKGHGRNGASSYTGAKKVAVPHPTLHSGRSLPRLRKRQSLSTERTQDAGENRGPSTAGGHRRTSWIACAATCAAKYSRRPNPKAWGPKNTTKPPLP